MQKRLLLVRHGETLANIDKVWHGSTDTALSEQGEQQRHLLAKNFSLYMDKPDYIVTSPLQRARLTAEAIAGKHGLKVEHNEDLQEYCIGDWEGYAFERLTQELGFFKAMKADEHYRSPGGESRYAVVSRIVRGIETAWQQDAQNIVVVAHSLAFSLALSHFITGNSDKWFDFFMDNTAVTELDLGAGKVLKFNQTGHLGQAYTPIERSLKNKLREE